MSRTGVIIGASGGIGKACARKFADTHNLAIHYHTNSEPVEAIQEELADRTSIGVYRADVTEYNEVENMMEQIQSDLGEITTLVNAAGSYRRSDLLETNESEYEQTMSINFLGVVNCVRGVLNEMRNSETNTQIVNISSMAGSLGSPTDPIYGGAKGAVNAFTKSLARQYTTDGVFSNIVAPATTETDLIDEYHAETVSEFPHDRLIQPEEVAEAVYFLGRTTSISGIVLEVDAGRRLTR